MLLEPIAVVPRHVEAPGDGLAEGLAGGVVFADEHDEVVEVDPGREAVVVGEVGAKGVGVCNPVRGVFAILVLGFRVWIEWKVAFLEGV